MPVLAALGAFLMQDGGAEPPPATTITPPPATRQPASTAAKFPLRPATDGSGDLLYEGKGFSARVKPDGSVAFRNKRIHGLSFLPAWLPAPVDVGIPSLQTTLGSLLRRKKTPSETAPPVNEKEGKGTVDESFLLIPRVTPFRPDPREGCRACDDVKFDPMVGNATGQWDLTDELLLFSGKDPARREKAEFLAATREVRVRRAVAAQGQHLQRETAALPGRLAAIACDTAFTPRDRRAIIEALRSEMDATPAGQATAATIARFLADHAEVEKGCPAPSPAGTPDGGAGPQRGVDLERRSRGGIAAPQEREQVGQR